MQIDTGAAASFISTKSAEALGVTYAPGEGSLRGMPRDKQFTLTVGGIGFGLSREQRAKVETEAQTIAIENFKQKAAELAKNFGFGGYTLREVSINANQGPPMRPRMMAAEASSKMSYDAAVPVEAGKTSVVVNVSGSVQLR